MAQSRTTATNYGAVDQLVLDQLRRTFDTSRLLTAIEIVDTCRAGVAERATLHSNLRCLHDMASHLIDDVPMIIMSEQPVWQLAEEILDEIEESHIELSGSVRLVDQIAALRPPDKRRGL